MKWIITHQHILQPDINLTCSAPIYSHRDTKRLNTDECYWLSIMFHTVQHYTDRVIRKSYVLKQINQHMNHRGDNTLIPGSLHEVHHPSLTYCCCFVLCSLQKYDSPCSCSFFRPSHSVITICPESLLKCCCFHPFFDPSITVSFLFSSHPTSSWVLKYISSCIHSPRLHRTWAPRFTTTHTFLILCMFSPFITSQPIMMLTHKYLF